MSTNVVTKIVLTTSADWEEWNKRFISQTVMYDLLGHGQVQGNETLLSNPIRPAIAGYPQKGHSITTRTPRSRAQTHDGTLGQASESQTISLEHEPRVSDLTADGQKSFNMAWAFYQDDIKAYEKQEDLVRKLKEWIATNVSSHYQETCCEPTEPLAEWYKNLKLAAGIDVRSEETNARERYKEALKTPKIKDLITWVDLWEKTMTVAKSKKVVETTKTSIWFQDFLGAIRGILPMWAAAYGISKDSQVDNDTLDHRKVANDLRREAGQYTETRKTSRIAKGSFGPTFADSSEDETSGVKGTSRKRKHAAGSPERVEVYRSSEGPRASTKRKHAAGSPERVEVNRSEGLHTSKKRKHAAGSPERVEVYRSFEGLHTSKHAAGSPERVEVCRACEGYHPTHRCYYLFRKIAPKRWIPKPHLQRLVDRNLKEDSTLENEVKQWTTNRPNRQTEKEKNDD